MKRLFLSVLVLLVLLAVSGCGPQSSDNEVFSPSSIPLNALRDYTFELQRDCFCTEEARTPVRITVRNRVVTEVRSRTNGQLLNDLALWPSIEQIYQQVDAALDAGDEVSIEHDAAGVPTVIRVGSLAADAGVVYTITNFRRL